jgi:adenine-specific DNA-methyltransferase
MSIDKIKTGDDLTQSLDIVSDNISKLKELFPEVLTEGKIDFKVLQDILGNEIEEEEEFYRFTWAGKSESRREAHKPSTGTLRPCKEESVDWDNTENLYIEGDNLEVLKLLQKSYSNKIKMIYIDPPYNTGKDFVYKDNYKDNLKNYQQVTGQVDDEGNKLSTNSESDGRYHSNWLNMMYPRLRLARNLLTEDGLIFISIDDNEYENLKKVCNEIFGELNFIENYIWESTFRPDNSSKIYRENAQYILCFSKNKNNIKQLVGSKNGSDGMPSLTKNSMNETALIFPDNIVKTFLNDGLYERGIKKSGYELIDDVHVKDGIILNSFSLKGRMIWSQEYLAKELENGTEIYIKSDGFVPYSKKSETSVLAPNTIIPKDLAGDVLIGRSEINSLFGKPVFDYPKPTQLIQYLINYIDDNDFYILDFFSGSASTANSVLKQNLDDSGKRRFILVQLPEKVDTNTIAYECGYYTLTEIGKERIRRAGKILKEENPLLSENLDTGFKVFKLDSSNIKGWDGLADNLENTLFESQENIKSDRKEEDVLFEILLKYGLDLTLPIEEKIIEGKKVFNVGFGALFICLGNELTSKVAEGIGQWKETLKPETCRVIFKDGGFTDVEKTNSVQTLKRFGIHEIKSI